MEKAFSKTAFLLRSQASSRGVSYALFSGLLIGMLLLTSCSNKLLNSLTNSSSSSSYIAPTSGSAVNIVTAVVLANLDSSSVQILGASGQGVMNTYCAPSSTGSPTCACNFQYTSNGNTVSIDSAIAYQEPDFIQCPYATVVPSTVSSMTVSIHFLSLNEYSNTETLLLTGTTTFLDLTNISSFVQPKRWECTDNIFIPNQFTLGGTQIIDMLQSTASHLAYPLNYYTTNFAQALTFFSNSSTAVDWNCPTNPETAQTLNIYSAAAEGGGPCTGAGECVISSPDLTSSAPNDRTTFLLASAPTGEFTIPVNSYLAPNVNSAAVPNVALTAGQTPPLGYAAATISNGVPNQETCPTSAAIPAGYHWVKVFLFRASLPIRTYQVSSVFEANPIYCNPGNFADGTHVFSDCGGVPDWNNVYGAAHPLSSTKNVPLADRVIAAGTNASICFDLNTNNFQRGACVASPPGFNYGPGCATEDTASPYTNFTGYTQYGAGTDIWLFNGGTAEQQSVAGTWLYPDPYNFRAIDGELTLPASPYTVGSKPGILSLINGGAPNDFETGGYNPARGAGYDSNLSTQNYDAASRYDFLFVVTPINVMSQQMQNTASAQALGYTPFRYRTHSECDSENPTTCESSTTSQMIPYDITLYDVASNGDPPPSDPNQTGIFPVCAIQPN